jgi:hypothetical protein
MSKCPYYRLPYDKWLARDRFIKQSPLVKAVAFICLLKMASSPIVGYMLDERKRPYPLDEIAQLVACSEKELKDALHVLTNQLGIFDIGQKEDLEYFCPEMLEDKGDE